MGRGNEATSHDALSRLDSFRGQRVFASQAGKRLRCSRSCAAFEAPEHNSQCNDDRRHPDDEDSALLAYLARGESARTAYLSLTRGDGGQNIIGSELFEALGVIRTEELLQARRLDGAEQYFTRAYDYGFSKTLTEAKSKWPEDVIKCDAVRAIRLFRPLVVISRFTGTPADGHGQHQYAGYISPIAVKAAADPRQCTDAGTPWQVLKFYVEQSFSDTSQPTIKVNTGQYDPVLGRSYFEVAMEGRSQHRSQGEGRLELHGDLFSGLKLVDAQTRRTEKEVNIFDGLNTSIAGADNILGTSERQSFADVAQASELSAAAYREYRPAEHVNTVAALAKLIKALRAASESSNRTVIGRYLLLEKLVEATAALRIASGVQIDALVDNETVVPGNNLFVAVKLYLPRNSDLKVKETKISAPSGWNVTRSEAPKDSTGGFSRRETPSVAEYYNISVPRNSEFTQPYWLLSQRDGDLFLWVTNSYSTLPFEPDQLEAVIKADIEGSEMSFLQPLQFRFADPSRGEIRREVNVVPALSVSIDRDLLVVPQSKNERVKRLLVSVTNNSSTEQSGNVSLNIASSPRWKIWAPSGAAFSLKTKGAKATVPFDITIPANTNVGKVSVSAGATSGEVVANLATNVVSYPHIQTHRYYTRANATVDAIDLKIAPERVGYIMGSGDEVPEAIRQMGMDVTMLEEKDLASGDLSKFEAVVVGIRASETRPDMMANKQRLLDYVNNGGNLVVQYQRGNFAQSGLTPYPVTTEDKQGTAAGSVSRVVDENAAVKILEPAHPIFNFPNKITDEDFKGWLQERNAYNLVTFDPKYLPLLESHDAGEQENKGGLVVAKVGKGIWIYCSYSFFRQLPAGVPGAYRLFDNLLSLPKAGN